MTTDKIFFTAKIDLWSNPIFPCYCSLTLYVSYEIHGTIICFNILLDLPTTNGCQFRTLMVDLKSVEASYMKWWEAYENLCELSKVVSFEKYSNKDFLVMYMSTSLFSFL